MVGDGLFRRRPRQEGSLRVVYVLQASPPEQTVFAVRREVIVEPGNESVVVQLDGSSEAISRVIQPVADRAVIRFELAGAECLVEISGMTRILDRRIDPQTQGIQALQLRGGDGDQVSRPI